MPPPATRAVRRLLVPLLALVLAAGCAPAEDGAPAGDAGAGAADPVTDPDTPVDDGGTGADPGDPGTPDDLAYEEVDVVPTRGTPRDVPLESLEATADGTQVVARWWSGVPPCTALAEVVVDTTDEQVTVTVREASEHPDGADVACIEIAQAKQHTVDLAEPLGDRRLVDGAQPS